MMVYVWLAIAGFISWLISTIAAGGGGLLLVPVVTVLIGVRAVPPVLGTGELIGSPGRAVMMWKHIRWDVVKWYLPGGLVGSVLGSFLFTESKGEWFQILIGVFLISTILQYRFGHRERTFKMRVWYFLPIGFAVALLSGFVGTMGPILNPFYLNYDSDQEQIVATKSFNSSLVHLAQVSTYTVLGAMDRRILSYGLTIGAAALLANWIGQRMLSNMRSETFRQIVIAMMVISGVAMIWDQREVLLRLFS
jgi:uncharacterized membrane protein YfcA